MSEHSKNLKSLIIGGSGFIGHQVAKEMSHNAMSVTVVDKELPDTLARSVQYSNLDFFQFESTQTLVENFDLIFNCMALSDIDDCAHKPMDTLKKTSLQHYRFWRL